MRQLRRVGANALQPIVALVTLLLVLSVAAVAPASALSPIEGVWSFNGGKVAIHPGPGGIYVGTVVAPTKFAMCTHPDGEEMWTGITPQQDGSYWGLHHWFFETQECALNPTPGPTAWRVMEAASGAHFLLVCFSSPEQPIQPTIASGGAHTDVTYGCDGSELESAQVAPLPGGSVQGSRGGKESLSDAVSLPSNKKCFSHRVFQIHLRNPKFDPLQKVVVRLGRHTVTARRHGNTFAATISLKGLPRGRFTVRISVTTVLGHHLSGRRTYHTCVKRRPVKHGTR